MKGRYLIKTEEDLYKVVYDSMEVTELSPYRFRITERNAGPIGLYDSAEEFINGTWYGLVYNFERDRQVSYYQRAYPDLTVKQIRQYFLL